MRAEISPLGELRLKAENDTEGYALAQWYEKAFDGKTTIVIYPMFNCTLGPQSVELKPLASEAEDD